MNELEIIYELSELTIELRRLADIERISHTGCSDTVSMDIYNITIRILYLVGN